MANGGLLLMETAGMGFRLGNLMSGETVFESDGAQGLGNYVGVSPDESLVAYSQDTYPAEIEVWEASADAPRYSVTFEDDVHNLVFSPDNRLLIVTSTNFLRVWDADMGDLLATLDNATAGDVAFSPDGTLMAVGGLLNVVRVWGVPAS
jgi:WD40 repeat protein